MKSKAKERNTMNSVVTTNTDNHENRSQPKTAKEVIAANVQPGSVPSP
jgi:hypothetical protein